MEEKRSIYISSVNRETIGESKSHDFQIKLRRTLSLDPNMHHEIGVDSLIMTYSWHNITDQFGNNKIKYSTDGGNTWKTVTFENGMYSYSDINDYLHGIMTSNGDKADDNGNFGINILFVLSTYKVVIELKTNYQVDLRNTEFGDLLGFDKKIISQTEYGARLPNITRSVDKINVHSDIVTNSIFSGNDDNLLCVIPTSNLTRSYSFKFEPRRLLFSEISKTNINEIRFYLTDSLLRPIDLNGIDWFMTLILRSRRIV